MKVNIETIQKIAHLGRLELGSKDEESFFNDFNKILDWMDKLNEVNTDNVQPLIHMSDEVNVMREDVALNTLDHDRALLNAPKKDSNYFRVPKFLGQE